MAAPTEDELRTAMMTFGKLTHEYWKWQKERAKLREALGFAASVIKSGEPWTETCERVIGGALAPFDPFAPPPTKNDARAG
jgi:hypothetical protein